MKNLLSKEDYCYKIYTLLMKNSAYPADDPHIESKIKVTVRFQVIRLSLCDCRNAQTSTLV